MTNYRSMGPAGINAFIAHHGAQPSRELDALCAQLHAHTTLLYWFTDLDVALAEAKRTRRPVLSLRLLGRLDEELSCANSRFFRRLLYPEPRCNQLLRDRFVLHWQSVRPVPTVRIDFGNGRTLEKTLTGNSLHLVLDPDGRVADALPGLVSADVFVTLLERAHRTAMAGPGRFAAMHHRALARRRALRSQVTAPEQAPRVRRPRSLEASLLAPTKHMVEMPVLRNVSQDVDADTIQNLELHAQIHQAFAAGTSWTADEWVAWIYRDLFLMPPDDPMLGLDVEEPFLDQGFAPFVIQSKNNL
jgi:hypothetical protein